MPQPFRLLTGFLFGFLAVARLYGTDEKEPARLRADVTFLAETIGPRSVFQGDSLARAEKYITEQLTRSGWVVSRQTYPVQGVECANLIAERIGTTRPTEIVVVGAHYDTVPQTPGADDNASGVAALLALARNLSALQPARTLRLVAFANEEPIYFQTALMGSLVYARECKARGDNITAMLSLETIGYFDDTKGSQQYPFPLSLFYPSKGNFIAVVSDRDSRFLARRVGRTIKDANLLPSVKASLPGSLQGVGWSDHWAFWQQGYPAVMITDTAIFRNPHYHRPTDVPATLDYERLAKVVGAVEATLKDLVNAP